MLSTVINMLMAGRSAVRWLLPAALLGVLIFFYWRYDSMRHRYDVLDGQFQTINRQFAQAQAGYQRQSDDLQQQIAKMRTHLAATAATRQAFQSIRETIPNGTNDLASPDVLAVRERVRATLHRTDSP